MKNTALLTLVFALSLSTGAALADPAPSGTNRVASQQARPATTHQTIGVVKAIDARAGKITIAHDAVTSLGWPPMTMPFRIGRSQAEGLRPGQRVRFEFAVSGMDATITKIAPVD